jgi:hypothetical protein
MALKNQAITICYTAWNTSTNLGQTGDAANHTLKLVQDGTEGPPTNSPSEVDSTNLKGLYKITLAAADMNYNCVVLGGASSTANVIIIPLTIITERGALPNALPGAAGGLFIAGTNAATVVTTSFTTTFTGNLTGSVGSVTGLTTATVAAAILVTPANLLATDTSGRVLLQPTQTGVTIPTVTTVGTLTTYTGNTVQTGDSFGRIGALGAGLTALAPSVTALSTANYTAARAGYLDNLNVGGAVASHADAVTIETAVGSPMQAGSSVALTSAGLDAVTIEIGLNARQSLAIIAAAVAGVGGSSTDVYAGAGVATQRIAFTAAAGQRTVVTLSPPA